MTFARPRPRLWPRLARAVWLLLAAANVGLLVLNAYADLDQLSTQLTDVVQATLEPEKVSLWLRS